MIVNSSPLEPQSQVIYQAFAMKTLVVASNKGGNVESISDGETGFLFRSEDAGSLSEIILSVLDNHNGAVKEKAYASRPFGVWHRYHDGEDVKCLSHDLNSDFRLMHVLNLRRRHVSILENYADMREAMAEERRLLQSLQVFFPCRDEGEESSIGDLRKPQEKYGTDPQGHRESQPSFQINRPSGSEGRLLQKCLAPGKRPARAGELSDMILSMALR